MKYHRVLVLPFLLAMLSAGCASNRIQVVAQRNNHFSPTPASRINMAQRPNPSPEDAELGSRLMAELKNEGFNIVTNSDAEYTLTYLIEDDSTFEGYRQPPLMSPRPDDVAAVSGGKVIDRPGSQRFEQPAVLMGPRPFIQVRKGIRLYLYANPQTHAGFQVAWTGCIEAENAIPSEREPFLINTLLGYFGQDYNGRVSLPHVSADAAK